MPESQLTKDLINAGRQAAPNRAVRITFLGEGSPPPEVIVTAHCDDVDWKTLLTAARDYLQGQIDLAFKKGAHRG